MVKRWNRTFHKIADAVFDKNQAYRVELVVEEGGLIRAKSFKKL
jgi:hypothetical protein